MAPFEELQQLWQSQPQVEPRALGAESRGMATALRRFRRRQYVINGVKLAAMLWMTWFLLSRLRLSVWSAIGVALFLAGFISALILDWRIQSAIARLDFTCPSAEFVDATLERLRDPNAPFRRNGWVCIALVAASVNVMYSRASAGQELSTRIASHAAITLFLAAAFALGLKVRAKRYAIEYRPLLERLAALKAAIEERAQ